MPNGPITRYILCHPCAERAVRDEVRLADEAAERHGLRPFYTGLEVVSHQNMSANYCLAFTSLEALNKALELLCTPTRIEI